MKFQSITLMIQHTFKGDFIVFKLSKICAESLITDTYNFIIDAQSRIICSWIQWSSARKL